LRTIESAWNTLLTAIAQARESHEYGLSADELVELIRHGAKLLDFIEGEIPVQWPQASAQQAELLQLRVLLAVLLKAVTIPTSH